MGSSWVAAEVDGEVHAGAQLTGPPPVALGANSPMRPMCAWQVRMCAGGIPGGLAWELHFFAARALLGPVRTGRRSKALAQFPLGRVDKFIAGEWGGGWGVPCCPGPARTDAAVATMPRRLTRCTTRRLSRLHCALFLQGGRRSGSDAGSSGRLGSLQLHCIPAAFSGLPQLNSSCSRLKPNPDSSLSPWAFCPRLLYSIGQGVRLSANINQNNTSLIRTRCRFG